MPTSPQSPLLPRLYAPRQHHAIYKTQRWLRFRRWLLHQSPLCVRCLPRLTPAVDVHHKIALRHGGAPFDQANCEALCHSCHAKLTRAGL